MSIAAAIPTTAAPTGRPLARAAVRSGVVAAAASTATAAAAQAAGVPLEIDGQAIPLLGFAQLTAVAAAVGALIAVTLRRLGDGATRRFVPIAMILTGLSCIPSVAMPPDVATKIVLVATHVVAAAIIVPALARSTAR